MDDQIIWKGKPSWKGFALWLILSALFLLIGFTEAARGKGDSPLVIVAFIILGYIAFYRIQRDFTVTDRRIIVRRGFFTRRTAELDIRDIRSINVNEGFFQRMVGIGDLEFTAAAGPFKDVDLDGVADPFALKEEIWKRKQAAS